MFTKNERDSIKRFKKRMRLEVKKTKDSCKERILKFKTMIKKNRDHSQEIESQ